MKTNKEYWYITDKGDLDIDIDKNKYKDKKGYGGKQHG